MEYYAVVYSLNYSIMSFSSINGTLGEIADWSSQDSRDLYWPGPGSEEEDVSK